MSDRAARTAASLVERARRDRRVRERCDTVELRLSRADADTRGIWKLGFVARDAKSLNIMVPEGSPHTAVYFDGTRWFYTWSESDVDRHLE